MEDIKQRALEVLVEELKNSNLRQYTCINDFGYSQVERNIVDRIAALYEADLAFLTDKIKEQHLEIQALKSK